MKQESVEIQTPKQFSFSDYLLFVSLVITDNDFIFSRAIHKASDSDKVFKVHRYNLSRALRTLDMSTFWGHTLVFEPETWTRSIRKRIILCILSNQRKNETRFDFRVSLFMSSTNCWWLVWTGWIDRSTGRPWTWILSQCNYSLCFSR